MKLRYLLGLCLATSAVGQTFVIGATREQTRTSMGPLTGLYSLPFKRTYLPQDEAFVRESGLYFDLWEYPSRANTFQYKAKYAMDASQSRLHPVDRLEDMTIIPDKAQSGMELMAQIPFAVEMCKLGCLVYVHKNLGFIESEVCEPPNGPHRDIAMQSAAGWSGDIGGTDYALCAIVHYDEYPNTANVSVKNIPLEKLQVNYIRISGDSLGLLREVGETILLGGWKP